MTERDETAHAEPRGRFRRSSERWPLGRAPRAEVSKGPQSHLPQTENKVSCKADFRPRFRVDVETVNLAARWVMADRPRRARVGYRLADHRDHARAFQRFHRHGRTAAEVSVTRRGGWDSQGEARSNCRGTREMMIKRARSAWAVLQPLPAMVIAYPSLGQAGKQAQ